MRQFKTIKITITLLVILQGKLFSQAQTFNPEQMREDFEILRGTLEEVHPGLYWYSSKEEVNNYFNQIWKSLDKDLTTVEYYRKILEVVSNVKCGHMWVDASDSLDSSLWKAENRLPLKLKIVDEKLYCVENNSPDNPELNPGDQVLTINGHSSEMLLKRFMQYTVGDGFVQTGRLRLIEEMFDFYYRLLYGQPSSYKITYINDKGKSTETVLNPLVSSNASNSTNEGNISLKMFHNSKTGLLKIDEFSDWEYQGIDVEFKNEIENVFNKIDSVGVNNLIIDLRENGGGEDYLGLLTLSFLIEKPLTEFKKVYLRSINPDHRENNDLNDEIIEELATITRKVNDSTYVLFDEITTKPFSPSEPHFKGGIFVITNGNTFSTATDVSAILQSLELAITIGEETGGGYYGNSSGFFIFVKLPNSKFEVRIPIIGYKTNVQNNVKVGRGVIPDYPIKPKVSDIIHNQDIALKYTLDLIEKEN